MKNKYQIAGLKVEIEFRYPKGRLVRQAEPYRYDFFGEPEITIQISEKTEREQLEQNPHLTPDELEYILTAVTFFDSVLRFDGLGLHSSAVILDGEAYLFSADSGVGKSTHTQLWCKHFGKERAVILNDDKPILRRINKKWYAFGTPWSGKSNLNIPKQVPLKGIAFIERGNQNQISRIKPEDSVPLFLNQTLRPQAEKAMGTVLDRTLILLSEVPIYRLRCRPEPEAAQLAYDAMKGAN